MKIKTRKIKTSDTLEVYRMYEELYEFLFQKGFMLRLNKKEVIMELIMNIIDSKHEHIYLAIDKNIVVGFICFSLSTVTDKFISPYGDVIGNLIELYVKEDYRKKSIGKTLLDISQDFFNKNNVKIIQVSTTYKNTSTIEFYEKLGFYPDYITFSKINK